MISRPAVLAIGAAVAATVSVAALVSRPEQEPARADDGAALFVAKGCATCHNGPDSTSPIGVGPSLEQVGSWAGRHVEGLSAEAYLAESMRSPGAFISPGWAGPSGPSDGMPVLQLTDQEVAALVEYLLSSDGSTQQQG